MSIGRLYPILTASVLILSLTMGGCGGRRQGGLGSSAIRPAVTGRSGASSQPILPPGAKPGERRPGVFRNVAAEAGIRFHNTSGSTGKFYFVETTPGGCAFLDYDNDGLLDVFLIQPGAAPDGKSRGGAGPGGPFCKMYHNDGNGHFTDVTHTLHLDIPLNYAQGVAVGDYDNDGYDDLYITAYGGNHLLHNEHGRFFRDVTAESGVGDTDQGLRWATSAAFGDYDNDGLLDLIVLHYVPWSPATDRVCRDSTGKKDYCTPEVYPLERFRLYHNDGHGKFTDVSLRCGINHVEGRGLGVVWIDTAHNGRDDLYITSDLSPQLLLRNRGGRSFEDTAVSMGMAYDPEGEAMSGMGIAPGDMDHSGWESLVVTNFSAKPDVVFQALPGGLFRNATYTSGIGYASLKYLAFGVSFIDFNRDGLPDVVVGNGHIDPRVALSQSGTTYAERKQLFRNNGGGQFVDDLKDLGDMAVPAVTRGLAVGDFDNDGRLDVLTNNLNGDAELFHNESQDHNHWISIRLEGVKSNRDGAGALVWLTCGGKRQLEECRLSSSYASSCDRRLFFGMGQNRAAQKIEVWWPSGVRQVFHTVVADRFYWLKEQGSLRPDPRNRRL